MANFPQGAKMTELRFVSREGDYLVFESIGGERFRVPVDESVRDGVRQTARAAQGTSPKFIQTRIRQGASVAEIAVETGEPEAYIELFAAAVQDELRYLLETALAVSLPDGSAMSTFRALIERQVGATDWSIARPAEDWQLTAKYESGEAAWVFNPRILSLEPSSSSARELSRHERELVADTRPLKTVTSPAIQAESSPGVSEPTVSGRPHAERQHSVDETATPAASVLDLVAQRKLREETGAAKPASSKGRASLPSWDEIVLGAGGPEEEF
jgi:hypothetical protein